MTTPGGPCLVNCVSNYSIVRASHAQGVYCAPLSRKHCLSRATLKLHFQCHNPHKRILCEVDIHVIKVYTICDKYI